MIYPTNMKVTDIKAADTNPIGWTTVTVGQKPYDVYLAVVDGPDRSYVGMQVDDNVPFKTVQSIANHIGQRLCKEVVVGQ